LDLGVLVLGTSEILVLVWVWYLFSLPVLRSIAVRHPSEIENIFFGHTKKDLTRTKTAK
jgi:hypothetical protein